MLFFFSVKKSPSIEIDSNWILVGRIEEKPLITEKLTKHSCLYFSSKTTFACSGGRCSLDSVAGSIEKKVRVYKLKLRKI